MSDNNSARLKTFVSRCTPHKPTVLAMKDVNIVQIANSTEKSPRNITVFIMSIRPLFSPQNLY